VARPRTISDQDILGEVRRAVLEQGPRFSIDGVADRLGVTAPALFKRFGSRNTLLLDALKITRPPFLDALEAGPDERAFAVQLRELFEKIGAWLATSMPCVMALKESGVPMSEVDDALKAAPPVLVVRTLARWLKRAHVRGVARVAAPEHAAMAMLGALQNRAFLMHLLQRTTRPRALAQDARHLCALFVEGIAPCSTSRHRTQATTRHNRRTK
jgi:AcrR family transcriptional regulator